MPIERIENEIEARPFGIGLNKFGNIRKGLRDDASGKMTDLTYFRTAFLERADGFHIALEEAFVDMYGDQPIQFQPVFVLGDTAAQAFDYWMEEHAKTKLVHQCDGKIQGRHYNAEMARVDSNPIPCALLDGGTCGCKPVARFHIILPEFCRAVNAIGYFTVHTTAIHDIYALRGWFKDIETLHNGKVSGIPLILGRGPRPIKKRFQDSKTGKWTRKEEDSYLLFLAPHGSYVQNVLMSGYNADALALASGAPVEGEAVTVSRPALPDLVPDDNEEAVVSTNWDMDMVCAKTAHRFDHENHQQNAIAKMFADGELTMEMDTQEAINAVLQNRDRRSMEKLTTEAGLPKVWNSDPKRVADLLGAAMRNFKMNTGMVLVALSNGISTGEIYGGNVWQQVEDFPGTEADAWAACLAYHCEYDPAKIESMLPRSQDVEMREKALEIAERVSIAF